MSADLDIVVIGAGAAGVGAARTIAATGLRYQLVEARARIGGRAWTDHSLSLPIDMGCAWLVWPSRNVFAKLGRELGYALVPDTAATRLFFGARPATADEEQAYDAEFQAVFRSIAASSEDLPVLDVARPQGRYARLIENLLGPWMMGEDAERVSVAEWYDIAERETDLMAPAGLGTIVMQAGRTLDIALDTPVRSVDWSGPCVVVETDRGSLRARATLSTLPNGVLAAEAVRFTPGLPDQVMAHVAGLPMGLLHKIHLEFARDCFGLPANTNLLQWDQRHQTPYWKVNLHGSPLALAMIGGDLARDLERAGEAASIEFALAALKQTFGTAVIDAFRRDRASAWSRDAWARGSYSVARPGCHDHRRAMRQALEGRLIFAGEAWTSGDGALVNGAYESGVAAAQVLIEQLAG